MIDRKIALETAKEWHTNEPFDAGHDWDHHQEVINNCGWIIEQEKLEDKVDLDVVLVAAAWHDFRRGANDFTVLQRELEVQGAGQDFIDNVIKTISSHSYGNSQPTLEAMILFDADKLAYVSTERIYKVLKAVQDGDMTKEVMSRYAHHFKERIPNIPQMLNFDSSKRRFSDDLDTFRAHISQTESLSEFVV